ncbi:transposase [Streptomyces californicus]|uniref:transposase n=1 Tax=Streptomyces californicus TaxID=67351 RepID=UPI001E5B288C|nr:transposase [Streptomyces californicus]MCC0574468.1 transposase [Streptomyces californicus]
MAGAISRAPGLCRTGSASKGILFALYNDRAWQPPPLEPGVGSGQSCWRRLDRWQKKSQADNNRQAICGTTKFTKDPTITDDSCDEFPFAGAYESGALNGVDHGKDCAQVTAVKKGRGAGLPTVRPTVAVIGTRAGTRSASEATPRALSTPTSAAPTATSSSPLA